MDWIRRRFRNLRVGTKILGVSLVVVTIFALVGLIGLLKVQELAEQQDRQYKQNVVALSHMAQLRSQLSTQQEAVLAHVLSDPGPYRSRYEAAITETDSMIDLELNALSEVELDRDLRHDLNRFESTVKLWRQARNIALDASRVGDRPRATTIVLFRSEQVAGAVKDRADAIFTDLVANVAQSSQQSRQTSRQTRQLILVLLVSGTVVAVGLSILAARSISRPLRATVDVFAAVAKGDFSRGLAVDSSDEIGQMGRSLNETLGVLRGAFASLEHRASHDVLTGLANRSLLYDRMTQAIVHANAGCGVAVLLIDLDGFKQVNDVYGHEVGDRLLVAVAQRLEAAVRPGDTVARLGGDEFAVLLDTVESPDRAAVIAARVLAGVQTPLVVGDVELCPRASVGLVRWSGHTDTDAMLRDADAAMYAAKQAGKGVVVDHALIAAGRPAVL